MPIVSVSLNDKSIEQIEHLRQQLGYSGRSEIVRAAIRNLVSDREQEAMLSMARAFTGSLTVIAPEQAKDGIHAAQHRHERIIRTQLHQCIPNQQCMYVLVVEGSGKEIKSLVRALENIPKVEQVRLVLAS